VALRGERRLRAVRGIPRACVLRRSIVLKTIYIDRLASLALPPSLPPPRWPKLLAFAAIREPLRYESRYDHPRNCRASVLSSSWRDVAERTLVRIHLEEHDRATIDPRTAPHSPHGRTVHPYSASCNVSDLGFSVRFISYFIPPRVSKDTLRMI